MISLEQVKLLDSKVSRLIDYIKKANEENTQLKERLNSNQKRVDELEILVRQFKQEQSKIEDGILSALDKLNQFEDAFESKLTTEGKLSKETVPTETPPPAPAKAEKHKKEEKKAPEPENESEPPMMEEQDYDSGELDIF